ncbi:MAG TPA: hypothetical protein VMH05_03505, partial [Bryobacteraceae bacterium]|nr:hypothetical protein [Bryobacteraceae bacterium]
MKSLLYFLSGVAGFGWLLMLMTHVAALLGHVGPLGDRTEVLFVGAFVVGFPAALAGPSLTEDMGQRAAATSKRYSGADYWKAILRGCPEWMKYLFYGASGYAVLNLVFVALGYSSLITFSGSWMAFYAADLAILYSAAKLWGQPPRVCPEGHCVGPVAKVCDQC